MSDTLDSSIHDLKSLWHYNLPIENYGVIGQIYLERFYYVKEECMYKV